MKIKNTKKTTAVQTTIAKGYRLKPSTHKMIKRVQKLLKISQDAVISQSLMIFLKGIGDKVKNHNSTNNSLIKLNKGNIVNEKN